MGSNNDSDDVDFPLEVETVEMAESALSDAKAALDAKDERIEEIENTNDTLDAKAEAFDQITAAHGLDANAEDFDVTQVVDRHTEDLRREVAQREASLARYDTDGDSLDARAEEFCGKSPQYLENRAGKLAREQMDAQAEQTNRSKAVVSEVEASRANAGEAGTGGMTNEEKVEEMADGVLDFAEVAEAKERNLSPSQFVEQKYDVEAADYGSELALQEAIRDVRRNGGGN